MAERKEYWSSTSEEGSIKISEDVVTSIAAHAATQTEGVSGLYSSLTSDIVSFLSKKNIAKGVNVQILEDNFAKIEICFLALYGGNICEVAEHVQKNVKTSVESMTGLQVTEVNVHVGGVTFVPETVEEVPTEDAKPMEELD